MASTGRRRASPAEWIGPSSGFGAKGEAKYEAVRVLGEVYVVGDTVHLRAPPGMPPFIARITRLWEDPAAGTGLCECAWYFRRDDIDKGLEAANAKPLKLLPNEVRFPPSWQDCGLAPCLFFSPLVATSVRVLRVLAWIEPERRKHEACRARPKAAPTKVLFLRPPPVFRFAFFYLLLSGLLSNF